MSTAYYSQRPALRRNSPLSLLSDSRGFAAGVPIVQGIDVGDSSDDEFPQPMKFSALTKALLESEAPGQLSSPKRDNYPQEAAHARNVDKTAHDHAAIDTPSRAPLLRIVRKASPQSTLAGSTNSHVSSPRILRIDRGPDSLKRSVGSSTSFPVRVTSRDTTPGSQYKTPAPSRSIRIGRPRAGSTTSVEGSARSQSRNALIRERQAEAEDGDHDGRDMFNRSGSLASGSDVATRNTQALATRTRNATTEPTAAPGSTRVKRATVGTGSFLRGAPMRRGFRRRESDDQPSPNEDLEHGSQLPGVYIAEGMKLEDKPAHVESNFAPVKATHNIPRSSSQASVERQPVEKYYISRAPSRKTSTESLSKKSSFEDLRRRVDSAQSHNPAPAHRVGQKSSIENLRSHSTSIALPPQRRPSISQSYKPPPLRVQDGAYDQENMPPPTFKRNKESDFKVLGVQKATILPSKVIAETPVPVSQSPRRALAPLTSNTPQRNAPPPPPKMSVLDAATKTAGASTTTSKKRRAHIVLNGKTFAQLGKLGKGGSSYVYSVMAENHKLFALKRVKLGDCDEGAVRGYKGEIDLLQRLSSVDRVIQLYDWELDSERGMLSLLMEKGEGDLNHVLSSVLSDANPKLDTVFVRWWWREMLQCVGAVHDADVVHSDLKPANFLVVNGRLKLIDFGIANKIDTDVTMNVHRDSHIGTPNYMSPESITDTNATTPSNPNSSNESGGARARVMKLGKPSDVWSLGCILYQMVYGRPPFAHIANQISRVMAITNSRVVIDFPEQGLGGVAVPAALKGTLRRCLQRDCTLRPTVAQLLSPDDPWLYPDASPRVPLGEDLLAGIIARVVDKCQHGEMPAGDAEVRAWAGGFLARIRDMAEREGVKEGLPS